MLGKNLPRTVAIHSATSPPVLLLALILGCPTQLLVDAVNDKKDKMDFSSYATLMNAILRFLSSSVPTIAIKTGNSSK